MTTAAIEVVKVGGSLLDWTDLPERLTALFAERYADGSVSRPVVVCGGGAFADAVRDLDRVHGLDAAESHRLAILAMDLASRLLASIVPDARLAAAAGSLGDGGSSGDILICLPSAVVSDLERAGAEPLPASWDVTSDSIAAWIAHALGARSLLLLKSTDAPEGCTRALAARVDLVDRLFARFAAGLERVEYQNLRDPAGSPALLSE